MTIRLHFPYNHARPDDPYAATTTGRYQPAQITRLTDEQWLRVAYDAGTYARLAGCPRQACPYYIRDRTPSPPLPMSPVAAQWFRGWDDAQQKGKQNVSS